MRTRAAVAMEAGKPLEIMEVNLEGPKAGEILVEIKATGICHTDEFTLSGADPEGLFPAILGHEGAGVVVECGPGVTSLKPGDHVIPLYTPECRSCDYCLNPKTNLCQAIRSTQGQGLMPDGTSRFSMLDGTPILHYMGCSTFANHTVLPEIALAKVRPDAPFDKICYIGCGVTTGIGAVINTAKVEIGSTAIVFGLGGIGLNVIQGLRLAGADQIVGVDLNPGKIEMARRFGMTDFVNPAEVSGDLVAHLVALTGGGADYSCECIGNVNVMRQALECAHKGWGQSIIIGVAGAGQEISTRPFQLVTGRVWKGSAFGGARGRTDVPKIVDMYMEGRINIDDMITHKMPLDDSRGLAVQSLCDESWADAIFDGPFGVRCLPYGNITEKDRSGVEALVEDREDWLTEGLKQLPVGEQGLIILDTPPGGTVYLSHALRAADLIIFVMLPDAASFVTLPTTDRWLAEFPEQSFHRRRAFVLLNRMNNARSLCRDVQTAMSEQLGERMIPDPVHFDTAVEEALASQQPITEYAPDGVAAGDFRQLADWLLEQI